MHDFSPFYSPYGPILWSAIIPFIAVLALWSVAIKGYALWVSARSGQMWWFIAMLVINTVGILEVIYLIFFSPPGSNKLSRKNSGTSAGSSSSSQA